METAQIIATNILRLLDESSVPAIELAEHLNVTRQTLTNYLKGTTVIDSVKLIQIAQFFDVPLDDIVGMAVSQKASILFRTALNYGEAIDDLSETVSTYIDGYCTIAKELGKNIFFLPEQYNLSIEVNQKLIDVNFEITDYTAKYAIDDKLKDELEFIAEEQRKLLGLGEQGAIELISALTTRGINVVFRDFDNQEVSGLSVCDNMHGSFIFINDSNNFTAERKLFTLAHEYGHILLHRPLYSRRIKKYIPKAKNKTLAKNLLDAMADYFAGYLLCPYSVLLKYNGILNSLKNTSDLYPIKKDLQVSQQSLMTSLKNHGFISNYVYTSYFAYLKKNNLDKGEPNSFIDDERLRNKFNDSKKEQATTIMKLAAAKKIVNANDISYYLDIPVSDAQAIFDEWNNELEKNILFDRPIN